MKSSDLLIFAVEFGCGEIMVWFRSRISVVRTEPRNKIGSAKQDLGDRGSLPVSILQRWRHNLMKHQNAKWSVVEPVRVGKTRTHNWAAAVQISGWWQFRCVFFLTFLGGWGGSPYKIRGLGRESTLQSELSARFCHHSFVLTFRDDHGHWTAAEATSCWRFSRRCPIRRSGTERLGREGEVNCPCKSNTLTPSWFFERGMIFSWFRFSWFWEVMIFRKRHDSLMIQLLDFERQLFFEKGTVWSPQRFSFSWLSRDHDFSERHDSSWCSFSWFREGDFFWEALFPHDSFSWCREGMIFSEGFVCASWRGFNYYFPRKKNITFVSRPSHFVV